MITPASNSTCQRFRNKLTSPFPLINPNLESTAERYEGDVSRVPPVCFNFMSDPRADGTVCARAGRSRQGVVLGAKDTPSVANGREKVENHQDSKISASDSSFC